MVVPSRRRYHSLQEQFEEKHELALQGDAESQYGIGVMYVAGWGTDQDFAKGMHWCRLASDQGHKNAPCVIGGLFEKGQGVEQDLEKAKEWYLLSADRGSEEAMRALGDIYSNGQGVAVDHQKAASWYSRSAEKWDWRSQVRLAKMYDNSLGVEQDAVRAYAWMFTANHNSGNGKATELERIRATMTTDQIDEAQVLAAEYVEKYGLE